MANILEIFGNVVPVTIVFDDQVTAPELRVPYDDRGFRTFFVRSQHLKEAFQNDGQQEIQGSLSAWIWMALAEASPK